MFLLGILSIQCKITRNRPNDTRRSTCQCDRPICHPDIFQCSLLSLACATFLTELCNLITRQAIELKSCSNPLRIQQVL